MTHKQRRILTIVVLLASLGLVSTQGIWVYGVFTNKQNEFVMLVNESLSNVATDVWKSETLTLANDVYQNSGMLNSPRNVVNIEHSGTVMDAGSIFDSLSSIMDSSTIKQIEKKDVKKYYILNKFGHIISAEIPIEQRVTIKQLDTLIIKEFKKQGVDNSNFRIAICDSGDIIIMSSDHYEDVGNSKIYKKQLFKEDPSHELFFVKLYFPDESWMILRSIWVLVFSVIMLITSILTIFIYTMYIISKQKKISEIKGDFISNITHELKTPISTISLAAQMLGDENIPYSAKNVPKLSGMIKEQSKHLSYLVEKVLQTSVFERQTIVLKRTDVSLHTIIKEAEEIMSLQLRDKKATLITELKATNDIISTEKSYFVNVITNLLDNALKYSKEASKIAVGTLNEDGKVLCYVADNGIGIKEDDKARIFEQFYRVHTGDVHDVKGFGLGLNYVKKVVELSGGTISLDSKLNIGTTFYMWFPTNNKTNT